MEEIAKLKRFMAARPEERRLSVVTCYDHAMAGVIETTGIDAILVGDSLGMAFAGYRDTSPVTVDQMIYHAGVVRRGAPSKLVIVDLPFMSYHVSLEDALRNGGRIIKESDADGLMLEGGSAYRNVIEGLVRASMPVMGHVGAAPLYLKKQVSTGTPDELNRYRRIIIESARILEESGVFAMILSMVPEDIAREITESVSVPTIGIASGRFCTGQILAINDILGISDGPYVKRSRKYADLREISKEALSSYDREVKGGKFPV